MSSVDYVAWSTAEKQLLVELVKERIVSRNGAQLTSNDWRFITSKFAKSEKRSTKISQSALQKLWRALKVSAEYARRNFGDQILNDPTLSAIDRLLQNLPKSSSKTKKVPVVISPVVLRRSKRKLFSAEGNTSPVDLQVIDMIQEVPDIRAEFLNQLSEPLKRTKCTPKVSNGRNVIKTVAVDGETKNTNRRKKSVPPKAGAAARKLSNATITSSYVGAKSAGEVVHGNQNPAVPQNPAVSETSTSAINSMSPLPQPSYSSLVTGRETTWVAGTTNPEVPKLDSLYNNIQAANNCVTMEDLPTGSVSQSVATVSESVPGVVANKSGTVTNAGTVTYSGRFANNIVMVTNDLEKVLYNRGMVKNNSELIANPGMIKKDTGLIANPGMIKSNPGLIANPGMIKNNPGLIANPGMIKNKPGLIANSGMIKNKPGLIANPRMIKNNPGLIANPGWVTNNSVMGTNNLNKTVTVTRASAVVTDSPAVAASKSGLLRKTSETAGNTTGVAVNNAGISSNSPVAVANNPETMTNSAEAVANRFVKIPRLTSPVLTRIPSCPASDANIQQNARLHMTSAPKKTCLIPSSVLMDSASSFARDNVLLQHQQIQLQTRPFIEQNHYDTKQYKDVAVLSHKMTEEFHEMRLRQAKELHEAQMANERKSADQSYVLHEAQMEASARLANQKQKLHEAQMELEEELIEQRDELHKAKIRAVELSMRLSRELHSLEVETARLKREEAETNNKIAALLLKKVELELEHMNAVSASSF